VARKYFTSIQLEIYPLLEEEYREMYAAGVDGITIYQETYNRVRYRLLHPEGKKSDYRHRYQTPQRVAKAGLRMLTMGILLGLSEIARDAFLLFKHLEKMQRRFPGVEYTISFPRLINSGIESGDYVEVSDKTLVKLICLTRILFPTLGINLSTRESASLRDHALRVGVTKISAASRTCVGGYVEKKSGSPQFQVKDNRSVSEIVNMLKNSGFDPVFTDWRPIPNTTAINS
jgi:2-iminoacetate synthase